MENNQQADYQKKNWQKGKSSPTLLDENTFTQKALPHDKQVEEIILGTMLMDLESIDTAFEKLTEDCFYVNANQKIFRALREMRQASKHIDIFTITDYLKAKEELEDIGGPYYLTRITNNYTGSNIGPYCNLVLDKFIKREVIRVSSEIFSDAFDELNDSNELLNTSEEKLLSIGGKFSKSVSIHISDVIYSAFVQINEWRKSESFVTGVHTGFPSLDRATRGWQNGDLIILAARPSIGKTALALQLLKAAATNKQKAVPVQLWSLEMKSLQLGIRMIASESKTNLYRLQTGKLEEEQMKSIFDNIKEFAQAPIFFDDAKHLTIASLQAKARRMKKKHNIGMILIDYLQLIDGRGSNTNRDQELSRISKGLKNIAQELDIPVIAISSLSREVEKRTNKKPQLSDLRESGAIEFDADVIIFLWAPDESDIEKDPSLKNRRFARIAKQRNGMLLTIPLEFAGETQSFTEHDEDSLLNKVKEQSPQGNWRPVNLPYADDTNKPF